MLVIGTAPRETRPAGKEFRFFRLVRPAGDVRARNRRPTGAAYWAAFSRVAVTTWTIQRKAVTGTRNIPVA